MKKSLLSFIILPLSIVCLSSCVLYNGKNKDGSPKTDSTTTATSGETTTTTSGEPGPEPTPEGQVKLYLVLGPNGRYEGNAGKDIASKFLENAVELTLAPGADLPGKSKITTTITGSQFSHWVDRDTTEKISVAPSASTVLVAVFEGGDGGNTPTPSSGLPEEGFGFLFKTAPDAALYYKVADYRGKWTDGEGNEYDQYQVANFQMIEGQEFSLYDFGSQQGWVIDLDGWSCGGTSATDTKWQEYLSKSDSSYTVLKTFNAIDIYIKLRYQHDILYMGVAD